MANTEYKATYKGSSRTADDRYYLQIWIYRGHEYEVEVPSNAWKCSSDYQRGGYNSQYNQHRRAQEQIDEIIENPTEEVDTEKAKEKAKKAQEELNRAIDMMFETI